MNASTLLSALQWAEDTFGTVRLGDQRRTVRAVEIASAIAQNPAASLPAQMQDDAATEAAYRFLQMPDVSYEKLIAPHVAQTRAQASKQPQVLLIQDTTEVDYQQHPTTTGLGPIGNGSHHGYLLQSVLAVVPASREVLGLMHQEPFLRHPAPKGETRREREQRQRESQVWERSVEAIGAPPAGVQWIHVGDRYSDIFSLLWLIRQQQCDFVVRAAQDRCVDLLVEQADAPVPPRSHHPRRAGQAAEAKPQHLFEVGEGWEAQGQQELHLEASKQAKARVAHVVISFGCLRLLPPQNQPAGELRPLVVWVVRVWEPEPPEGVEGLEWVLLTSVPPRAWSRPGNAWTGIERAGSSRTIIKASKRAVASSCANCRVTKACAVCWGCWPRRPCGCCNCGRPHAMRPSGGPARSCPPIWCRWWRCWPSCPPPR